MPTISLINLRLQFFDFSFWHNITLSCYCGDSFISLSLFYFKFLLFAQIGGPCLFHLSLPDRYLMHSLILSLITHPVFIFYNPMPSIKQFFHSSILLIVHVIWINLESASIFPLDNSTPNFIWVIILFREIINIFFYRKYDNFVCPVTSSLIWNHVDGFIAHEQLFIFLHVRKVVAKGSHRPSVSHIVVDLEHFGGLP